MLVAEMPREVTIWPNRPSYYVTRMSVGVCVFRGVMLLLD